MFNINLKKHTTLLFDFDGTLVDTEPLHYKSFQSVMREIDCEYVSFEDHCKNYGGIGSKGIFTKEIKRHTLDPDLLEKLTQRRHDIYSEVLKDESVEAMPGAIEFLNKVKEKGFKLAIVSGGAREDIRKVMELAGIPNVFETYVTEEDKFKHKPDPEAFLKAVEKLNSKKEETLIFEDALNGVEAAKNAEIDCVAIKKYIDEDKLRESNQDLLIITSYKELTIS